MSTQITWQGHNCWSIETAGLHVLLDPFLDQSPTAPVGASEVNADIILLSHGHFDHVADAVAIAKRTGATIVANFEICEWFKRQGISEEKVIAMNLGGGMDLPFGRLKMTLALHSSGLPDGSYGGVAGGFLLGLEEGSVYFACDTALFLDMKLIGLEGLKLAVLPIGDHFTMGPEDSIEAIRLLNPKRVAPCHYGTWPLIEQNADVWAEQVRSQTSAEPIVLPAGEKMEL